MSSPPEPRTFEGWIEEDWPGGTRRPDVMAVLEPYREAVQYALDDFDDETQSWRDQCGRIYGWGTGPHDEGAVPHAVQKKVSEMMTREPEAVEPGARMSPPSPWRWQPFARGLEVYTRDPVPPAGEPFTGRYRGSALASGHWRVYPDEDAAEPAVQGQARGATVEERMGAAREAVELWVAAPKLRERVGVLEEALAEALDGWEGTVSDVGVTSYHTIKRLRALLSEGAGAAGKGEGES